MNGYKPMQCYCGCNVYSPQKATGSILSDEQPLLSTTPTKLLELTYEDDDGPSDDHEYISVKITEFAELIKIARECNCRTDTASDQLDSI